MATAREKAQEKIRKAQEAILEARQELRELDRRDERFGPEPGVDHVIRFNRRFAHCRTSYTYAAIHAPNGFWYLTGTEKPERLSWEHLKGFIGDSGFEIAAAWNPRPSQREVTWG
ncbi:hypothetical protein [Amycolatopsis sp.]|uniref:hypothetical protein n=1 Tax=Amycolatopsis sp. TaxID=37632 RepID=UPI002C424FAE|nr:hypothetical protein [Amycolatopsis sp.]HVV11609.1 hypothetical protein [Amycolatopsis sp.]